MHSEVTENSAPISLGISACLLGQNVRYDGGHQHDRFLTDTLGRYVNWVPVCPEVECGLPVPREAMRLVGTADAPRLVTISTKKDLTRQMLSWARRRVGELESDDLCGFIFKSKSPSSGMERVKVYSEENGIPAHNGVGMFARAFMEHFPLLPCEEEGRLHDPVLRENFIERIFVYRRWRETIVAGSRAGTVVDFHTRHKLLILSHSTTHYREMGRLVAQGKVLQTAEGRSRYQTLLMEALALKATVKKQVNVLQHMMGYFKTMLSPDEKQEMLEVIEQYRREYVPLIVPVTLINHYVRKYGEPYLAQQYYLNPHPLELKLRNHV
ncbi:MAG: DUF523 and DUF1722 domain-containing protein [Deltaproteobacteria bacterium]|nr:DUF523 and DUF1722 domain-containing protein [Deltaproteobacteria bacterium]